MTIQPLADDSVLSLDVLPSVWAGYKYPSCRPAVEMAEKTGQAIQIGYNLSKEEADQMANSFWTESVHDFCIKYLDEKLMDEDHAKILKTANEWIKNGTVVRIDETETDLTKLLAAKVVLNAHQRANHAMSHACFLGEYEMLPGENVFMLQKGTSPVFYGKDEFERSESLKDRVQGVPDEKLLGAFTTWIHRGGIIRYAPALNQMGGIIAGDGMYERLDFKEIRGIVPEQKAKNRPASASTSPKKSRVADL